MPVFNDYNKVQMAFVNHRGRVTHIYIGSEQGCKRKIICGIVPGNINGKIKEIKFEGIKRIAEEIFKRACPQLESGSFCGAEGIDGFLDGRD